MQLPSRLALTTLGDVLGALHRERVAGVLELEATLGVIYRVHFWDGLVSDVQAPFGQRLGDVLRGMGAVDRTTSLAIERCGLIASERPIGERLVQRGVIRASVLLEALTLQARDRLESLYQVTDARLAFRVARRGTEARLHATLSVAEFLHGRERQRSRRRPARRFFTETVDTEPARAEALRVLGLPPNSGRDMIRTAFRRRALAVHPDRHPHASAVELARMNEEFVKLNDAYRVLVA